MIVCVICGCCVHAVWAYVGIIICMWMGVYNYKLGLYILCVSVFYLYTSHYHTQHHTNYIPYCHVYVYIEHFEIIIIVHFISLYYNNIIIIRLYYIEYKILLTALVLPYSFFYSPVVLPH